jgi:broad specificity phosphatase PhoE
MQKTKALLVRHEANIYPDGAEIDRTGVITDRGLTIEGRGRLPSLVDENKALLSGARVIYTSTDFRCQQTAQILSSHLNIGIIALPELRSVGLPQGTEALAFVEEYLATGNWHSLWLSGVWGCEGFSDVLQRTHAALAIVTNSQFNTGPNSIIMVGHEETDWLIRLMRRLEKILDARPNWTAIMEEVIAESTIERGSIHQIEF